MISPATWTTRHLQALVAALGRLLRRPLGALLTTLVIAVALALPAGLWLLVQNARSATGDLATAVQVSAFLKVGTSVERAQELATAVRGQPGIATVTLITAEQGLKEFRERSDFGKALDALESNPLPHTLGIQPTTVQRDAAALERLRGTLAGWPEVEIVQADTEWAQRLAALLAVMRTLFLASAVLFGLGVLAVIGNTTRVEIAARLPEIAVTKLVGGSDAFIRRPFLYSGLFQGLLGGLLAVGLLAALLAALEAPVARLVSLYGGQFRLAGLAGEETLVLVLAGTLLGLVGAWVGAARQIARISPQP
jgi:cell division transport system permease protein